MLAPTQQTPMQQPKKALALLLLAVAATEASKAAPKPERITNPLKPGEVARLSRG